MITEVSLTNFKSWKQIEKMRFAPITGLFGTNSSGKTSILQLLLLLKQTVESPDRAQTIIFGEEKNALVNLGSFRELIHRHDETASIDWELTWSNPQQLVVYDPADPHSRLFASGIMSFESQIAAQTGRPYVRKMSYRLGSASFTMSSKGNGGNKYDLATDAGDFKFIRNQGRPWDLPSPVKCYGFPDQVKAYFQNAGFLSDLQLSFEQLFNKVYYLGPLREYPKRQYSWAGSEPADMGQRGERVVEALLAARSRDMTISLGKGKKRRSLEEHVAHWLRDIHLVDDFSVQPVAKDSNIYTVKVRKTATGAETTLTDVGFGVSQILPALVLCFYVPEGSTIILEQPEIHLHPSVQADLADVFIDAVTRRGIQIIFESHSEHLLRRLQRRLAEAHIAQDRIALYFTEMPREHSILSPLAMDEVGNITNWPKDFFGDQFGEIAEMARAALARKVRS